MAVRRILAALGVPLVAASMASFWNPSSANSFPAALSESLFPCVMAPVITDVAAAAIGQRYLILNAIGNNQNPQPATAWGPLVAEANDIIEYDGEFWDVSFGSTTDTTNIQYMTNETTGLQYLWTGTAWVKSFEGIYPAGSWSIVL